MAVGFFESSADPSQPDSYDAIQRKRKLAELLMAQGMSGAPVTHWMQGLANVAKTAVGAYKERQADQAEGEANKEWRKLLADALGPGAPTPAGGASMGLQPPAAGVPSAPQPGGTAPSMGAVPPGAATPVPPGALTDAIQAAAAKSGIDPEYLTRTAQLESSYGKNLQSPLSSAGGPFAFTNGTARQYGLTDKNDPNASADAAARLALDNRGALVKALGRDPSNAELYLAHQQGAGGARALLSNPQANVVDSLMPVYGGNRSAALQAVRNNGGSADMTAGQFAGKWTGKFGSANPADMPAPGSVQAGGAPMPPGVQGYAPTNDRATYGNFRIQNPDGSWRAATPAEARDSAESSRRDQMRTPEAIAAGGAPMQPPIANIPTPPPRPTMPGDNIPLGSPQEQAFTRLEGQPSPDMPALGAVPAGGAPMPSGPAPAQRQQLAQALSQPQPAAPAGQPDQTRALMVRALTDPRLSPTQRQQAMSMVQLLQKDDKPMVLQEGASLVKPDGRGGYTTIAGGGAKQSDAIRNYEYYSSQERQAGRQPKPMDQWQTDQKVAGATKIDMGPGPTSKVYDTVSTRADEARAAAGSLPAFQEAKRLVDSGQIILGQGADARVAMQKVGAVFGLDATAASNAETFRSAMAPTVLGLVKGLGAGSGISNADRDFAERAAGGNINLEPATIKRLLDIGMRASQYKVEQHNKMLDSVYPESDQKNGQVRSLFKVDVPTYEPPKAAATTEQTPRKSIGGKTYEKRADGWYEVN